MEWKGSAWHSIACIVSMSPVLYFKQLPAPNKELSYDYPEEESFYRFEISSDETSLTCKHISFGPSDLRVVRKNTTITIESAEKVEGSEDTWEVIGDVPLPVILYCVLYTKCGILYKKLIERRKRVYTRCGKVVLTAGTHPKLCATCACKGCFMCGDASASDLYPANCCKNCAPKARGLCGKCGDPLKGSQVEGKLCKMCGLGSRQMNCARMVFGANI
jgi:hypothetical protein